MFNSNLFFNFGDLTGSQAEDTFTSSGTWTCPVGTYCVDIITVGGGGGGGGAGRGSVVGTWGAGGGGGGGAGVSQAILTSSIPSTLSIVVGTGGTGGAGAAGSGSWNGSSGINGGFSCVNGVVCAPGGGAGSGGPGSVCNQVATANGGAGGAGNLRTGGSGGCSAYFPTVNDQACAGLGGGTIGPGGGGGGAGAGNYLSVNRCGIPGAAGAGQTFCGVSLGQGSTGACVAVSAVTAGIYGAGGGGGGSRIGTNTLPGCNGGNGSPGLVKIISYARN